MSVETMKNEAFEARELYRRGEISRSAAKEAIQPYIAAYNDKATSIAAKYGMRPKKINMASFLR